MEWALATWEGEWEEEEEEAAVRRKDCIIGALGYYTRLWFFERLRVVSSLL